MSAGADIPLLDLDAVRELLLEMARQRTVADVLELVVRRLAAEGSVALARIWLKAPGDICSRCRLRDDCPDQTECLHLAAGAGRSRVDEGQEWSYLDGDFRRFPLGIRKVGRIAATGRPIEVNQLSDSEDWLAKPDWARREGIQGFGGQPLLYRGETLGVLAVFSRLPMSHDSFVWLRAVADHAATAIANARAFEEIERLQRRLELENEYLREEIRDTRGFGEIVGGSGALRKVMSQVDLVAPAESSVLIHGESGTGKELIARAIHERSRRKDRPMVKVNCASIPRELFESEFFGHVKGAFTGAVRDRIGRFQLADRGTLFLDEVGEIPFELQSKLLRVLQEGTFERVGEESTRQVDVRLIAATNRDLKAEVEAGRFREDLYYRLSVFPIEATPLRDRLEDIPPLAAHFLEGACRRMQLPIPKLRKRHVEALQSYSWPGNVRELQNVIERAAIRSQSGPLEFDLPGSPVTRDIAPEGGQVSAPRRILTADQIKQLERDNVQAALEACRWRVSGPDGAARLLGLKPTTLASKIKTMKLR